MWGWLEAPTTTAPTPAPALGATLLTGQRAVVEGFPNACSVTVFSGGSAIVTPLDNNNDVVGPATDAAQGSVVTVPAGQRRRFEANGDSVVLQFAWA